MHQVLDLEDVASTDIGSADHQDLNELFDGVLNYLEGLEGGLTLVLLAHEKQSKTNSKIFGEVVVELSLISTSLHQSLHNSFSHVSVALSNEA